MGSIIQFKDDTFESQFEQIIVEIEKRKSKQEKEKQDKKVEEEKQAASDYTSKDWTEDDVASLTKAIVRFPPGTSNRWETIANFVGDKTQKQVITKAKEIQER